MTTLFALTHARLLEAFAKIRDREEGQGLTEYVFLIVGVVGMVGLLIAALTGALTTLINNAIGGI